MMDEQKPSLTPEEIRDIEAKDAERAAGHVLVHGDRFCTKHQVWYGATAGECPLHTLDREIKSGLHDHSTVTVRPN